MPAGRAHRHDSPEAQGNHLPVGRHEESRHHSPSVEDDIRRRGIQRDVLFQSARAGRSRAGQGERRLERGHHGPKQRARQSRNRPVRGFQATPGRRGGTRPSAATARPPGHRRSRAAAEAGAGFRRSGSISPQHDPGPEHLEQDRARGAGGLDSKTVLERAEPAQRADRHGSAGTLRPVEGF